MAFSLSIFPFSVELAGRSKCELKEDVLVLTDSLYQGRKCGSERMVDLSAWIAGRFGQIGLEKYEGKRYLNFELSSGGIGRNVVGVMPGTSGKFIVVMAYYDALGVKDGALYPGADSNASGVAVLLDVARLLMADEAGASLGTGAARSSSGFGSGTGTVGGSNGIGAGAARCSSGRVTVDGLDGIDTGTSRSLSDRVGKCDGVIFVALDGHFDSYAGAQCLLRSIPREKIRMVVNLDTLGGSTPVDKARPRYLLALGGEKYSRLFDRCTQAGKLYLYYEYYRSESFTRMFYRRLGDQTVFLDAGIRSIVFTSGISMDTNKPTDTADKLDYNALRYRSLCIARWINLVGRR